MNNFEVIDNYIRQEMTSVDDMGHEYDHVKRVFSLCFEIGQTIGANLKILGAAALLHDIGRVSEQETGISHSISSGEIATAILQEVGYSKDEIKDVKQVIRTHRFSEGLTPTSLEGEILSDADKLDAMGAIGVYRAIAHSASKGVGVRGFLQHVDEKLLKLQDLMYTEIGKEQAQEKHRFLDDFVRRLRVELDNANY